MDAPTKNVVTEKESLDPKLSKKNQKN